MKKLVLLFTALVILSSCSSQKLVTQIDQKLDAKTAKEIVLVKIINDSRCPENVQCIWAGEVQFEVAVYEDSKITEQTQLKLTPHNQEEVVNWFAKRLPKTNKTLKTVGVFPYPKDGTSVNLSDYVIKLGY
jgi:hypothetical protein